MEEVEGGRMGVMVFIAEKEEGEEGPRAFSLLCDVHFCTIVGRCCIRSLGNSVPVEGIRAGRASTLHLLWVIMPSHRMITPAPAFGLALSVIEDRGSQRSLQERLLVCGPCRPMAGAPSSFFGLQSW